MGTLLMFATPLLPFVCVTNVLAALVLLDVSAANVVVALNVVPAVASRGEKVRNAAITMREMRTHTPKTSSSPGERRS